MKVLMFSLDPTIVRTDRNAGKRMVDYSTLVDKLTIVLFRASGPRQVTGNLAIYPTARSRPISALKGFWIGWKILRSEKYDLITTHDFSVPLIVYPLSRMFRVPFQFQVHSTFLSPYWKESLKNILYRVLGKFFASRADCVRVVSDRIKRDLVEVVNVPRSKITVLPIFTDTKLIDNTQAKFDLHKKFPQFDFIALTASRLVRQKNVGMVFASFKKLVEKYPRMGLVVVGSGPHEKALKQLSESIKDNVVFEGWSDDVVSYYKGADVFLLPSNYEGWAMSVIEAMASGTAVIMTDVGCAGEVVHNGENGIVIPVNDQGALEKALETLYENPKERTRLASEGRNTVLSMTPSSWSEYLALYKKDLDHCARV